MTIEETAELRLAQPHVVRLEARPPNAEGAGAVSVRDLVRTALRMRPDRIVVGEVRGAEALDLLQALNTGHEGALSTVHANGPVDALRRVATLALFGGVSLPFDAVTEQVGAAVDLVVQVERGRSGARRILTVAEVLASRGSSRRGTCSWRARRSSSRSRSRAGRRVDGTRAGPTKAGSGDRRGGDRRRCAPGDRDGPGGPARAARSTARAGSAPDPGSRSRAASGNGSPWRWLAPTSTSLPTTRCGSGCSVRSSPRPWDPRSTPVGAAGLGLAVLAGGAARAVVGPGAGRRASRGSAARGPGPGLGGAQGGRDRRGEPRRPRRRPGAARARPAAARRPEPTSESASATRSPSGRASGRCPGCRP